MKKEIKQLLDDSMENIQNRKKIRKTNHDIATEAQLSTDIDKYVYLRVKDYAHYRGNGWENGNPLLKIPKTKFPDRVSRAFRKIVEIVNDLDTMGNLEFLDEYLNAMKQSGIEIKIQPKNNKKITQYQKQIIDKLDENQSDICKLADDYREQCREKANEIKYCPKDKFNVIVDLYTAKMEEEHLKKEEIFQKAAGDCEMVSEALIDIIQE